MALVYFSEITSKGNSSISHVSQEDAEHRAKKLDDANCTDCSYCDNCTDCDSCNSCNNCNDCANCDNCDNRTDCDYYSEAN